MNMKKTANKSAEQCAQKNKDQGWWSSTVCPWLKRKWWYLVLLVATSAYIIRTAYIGNNVFTSEIVLTSPHSLIFLLWIILMILPLFSEVELFGIKLKKEIAEVKTDIKSELLEIRAQILNVRNNNSVENNFHMGFPAQKNGEELKALLQCLVTKTTNNTSAPNDKEPDYDDKRDFLLNTRVQLESMLNDLCSKLNYGYSRKYYIMVNYLANCELIDSHVADALNQIARIANEAMHCRIVGDAQYDFVVKILDTVKKQLENAEKNLPNLELCICPFCRFQGYARYMNECPNCGRVFCDD